MHNHKPIQQLYDSINRRAATSNARSALRKDTDFAGKCNSDRNAGKCSSDKKLCALMHTVWVHLSNTIHTIHILSITIDLGSWTLFHVIQAYVVLYACVRASSSSVE